jgi:hypothetical protein
LIRDDCACIEGTGKPNEPVQVAVELLLPLSKHLTTKVFASKMGRQGIDDYQLHIIFLNDLIRLLEYEYLMIAVVAADRAKSAGEVLNGLTVWSN